MGVGLDLTEEDLKYGTGTAMGHREAMLANQRTERNQEAAKALDDNKVAKWVGFTESGPNWASDPSRVPTEEPETYKKHAASKLAAKKSAVIHGY